MHLPVHTSYGWCHFKTKTCYMYIYFYKTKIKSDVTFLIWQIRGALFWFLAKECCQNQTWECWLCGAGREHSKFSPGVSQGFTGDLGFRSTSPYLLRIFLSGETSPSSPELVYCNSACSPPVPRHLQDDKRMYPRGLLHSLAHMH